MDISSNGSVSQSGRTTQISMSFGGSALDADATNSGGPSLPLLGGSASTGRGSGSASQLRQVLRIGTAMEAADGSGHTGHRLRAVVVVEIQGADADAEPLWVVGDLVFRATETPPDEAGSGSELPQNTGWR